MSRIDYQTYIVSPAWQAKRKAAIEKAGGKCVLCRATQSLHVHHNTYERLGNEDLDDLTCLCKRCHDLYHQQIDPRTSRKAEPKEPKKSKNQRRKEWQKRQLIIEAGRGWTENLISVTVTPQYINDLHHYNGSISPRGYRLMGLTPYPRKGWRDRINNTEIKVDSVELQAELAEIQLGNELFQTVIHAHGMRPTTTPHEIAEEVGCSVGEVEDILRRVVIKPKPAKLRPKMTKAERRRQRQAYNQRPIVPPKQRTKYVRHFG